MSDPPSDKASTSFEPRASGSSSRLPDQKPFSYNSGGRGRGGRQGKKRDLGRSEWSKLKPDKRARNEKEHAAKRQRVDGGDAGLPIYATEFSDDAIAAEERRPKKKVAVLIGYSGTGYKGMQLTHDQKTIEGDLFQAFVAAGAISKANADDPKKSSFVRCARTDKGVHAAGNVISLKLIVEDDNIVEKINEQLSPQIRVWGYERTNNSFSAYQFCDSRIYEYLIPTHSFLPPHPSSYLGKKINGIAKGRDDEKGLAERQAEVASYWEKIDAGTVKRLLDSYDTETREILRKALFLRESEGASQDADQSDEVTSHADISASNGTNFDVPGEQSTLLKPTGQPSLEQLTNQESLHSTPLTDGIKKIRSAYVAAKRAYRIDPVRLRRVREALALYEGTHNFHNYTVQKQFSDPSAKRVIKTFIVNPEPILINGTEWLSLKVHGQSFMMHQIRKMVGMVALIVRCGCEQKRIIESYGRENISIPKAPSLGLLLERPVFDSYNKRAKHDLGKEAVDFEKYKAQMNEFKQREIYERMYRDEERDNVFGNFFNHVDNFPEDAFLFVTSGGIDATKVNSGKQISEAVKDTLTTVDGNDSDEEPFELLSNAEGVEG